LERQSAVHKRLLKKQSTAWGRRQQVHKKKYTPCQQRFVPHVYYGPFLCGWQLSTSWQIPIVAAAASWPISNETKEADHLIFLHSFEYSQSQSSIVEKQRSGKS
jgi:hypothetical protein